MLSKILIDNMLLYLIYSSQKFKIISLIISIIMDIYFQELHLSIIVYDAIILQCLANKSKGKFKKNVALLISFIIINILFYI